MLAGKLHYCFPKGETVWMGKTDKDDKSWKPTVILAGVGIQKKHCKVEHKVYKSGNTKVLIKTEDKAAATTTFVNGDNFFFKIYAHDTLTGQTALVSVSDAGDLPDADSFGAEISTDGRIIVFSSMATNLAADVPLDGGFHVHYAANPLWAP